jgi:Protein of unknown function (DUF3304)
MKCFDANALQHSVVHASLAALLLAPLGACSQDNTLAVGYKAYNHTATSIVSIIVNGEGGILHATAYGGGGEICCVALPTKWHPGLKATIKWQEEGTYKVDEHGAVVKVDGVPVLIRKPYKERIIDVPKYEGGERTGQFRIHFFPNDEVKVTVLLFGPGDPRYPYPRPRAPNEN